MAPWRGVWGRGGPKGLLAIAANPCKDVCGAAQKAGVRGADLPSSQREAYVHAPRPAHFSIPEWIGKINPACGGTSCNTTRSGGRRLTDRRKAAQKKKPLCHNGFLVEVAGFEPTTFWSRTKRATKLRYTSEMEPIKGLEPLT